MRARPSLVKSAIVAMAFMFGLLAWAAAAPAPAPPAVRCSCSGSGASAAAAVAPRPVVIGAAGDVACASEPSASDRPDSCQYDDTADLLDGLTAVLVLGDGQYETGDYDAYVKHYGPTWGRFRTRTFPAPGNHEYAQDPSSKPRGYFRYFGDRVKGPDGLGYYSYDLPTGCTPGKGGVLAPRRAILGAVFRGRRMRTRVRSRQSPAQGTRCTAWLKSDLAGAPSEPVRVHARLLASPAVLVLLRAAERRPP